MCITYNIIIFYFLIIQAYSILITLNEYGELDLVYSKAGDDLEKSKMGNAKLRYVGYLSTACIIIMYASTVCMLSFKI